MRKAAGAYEMWTKSVNIYNIMREAALLSAPFTKTSFLTPDRNSVFWYSRIKVAGHGHGHFQGFTS